MRKVAFLSAAHIHTKGFIETIRRDRLFEIAAVWDDVPKRGATYAEQAGGRFVARRGDVLRDPSIEGVIITSENTTKLPLVLEAIRAGKAIMCEKPVAMGQAGAAAIRRALRASRSAKLVSGYYVPYGSFGRTLKAFLASGRLGKPLAVQYRNCHQGAFGRWFDSPDLAWFTKKRLAGGGGFLDLGTHAVHALTWLFGPVESASAIILNQTGLYPGIDDTGRAILRFRSGVLAGVEAGWTSHGGGNPFFITGTKGVVEEKDGKLRFTPAGGKPQWLTPKPSVPVGVRRLAALMAGRIPEREWRADVESFLQAGEAMEACYRSAATGRTIRLAHGR
jgi:1,5-anhydro-D-fructose reductase (1,5-anhydro-D-mannitol-forming)